MSGLEDHSAETEEADTEEADTTEEDTNRNLLLLLIYFTLVSSKQDHRFVEPCGFF